MEQLQQIEPLTHTFEWPASEPPHPLNLALTSQLYTTLMPVEPATTVVTMHLPSGWSSNDVIQVSTCSLNHQRRFIVKLPRHQLSSSIAAICKAEALRTNWPSKYGFGPKVLAIDEENGGFAMEDIEGRTLMMEMITDRLPRNVNLLRRIHGAELFEGMKRYDPTEVVRENLVLIKERKAMRSDDIRLVESIIRNVEQQVTDHPWMPCHNDFHSHNVMLDNTERMLAIDFEGCDLGDPMWDLAYLTANLEQELHASSLENLYGASVEDRRRVRAYVPLALAHCATWTALHGGVWTRHQEEVTERLRKVLVDLD